jgi:CheY-like chemotaxis protein
MPIMDGYEFLRRKKTDPDIAEIPVVVISATPPTSLEGVEKVLTKPIDLEQLMETVRRYFWSREISIRDRASATDR